MLFLLVIHTLMHGMQAMFGSLQLTDEVAGSDPAGLAALAALQHHLQRMLASQELASTAQLVLPFDGILCLLHHFSLGLRGKGNRQPMYSSSW